MSQADRDSKIFFIAIGLSLLIHLWVLAVWVIVHLAQSRPAPAVKPKAQISYFAKSSKKGDAQQAHGREAASPSSSVKPENSSVVRQADGELEKGVASRFSAKEPDFLRQPDALDQAAKTLRQEPLEHQAKETYAQQVSVPMLTAGPLKPEDYPAYFNRIGSLIREKAFDLTKTGKKYRGEIRVSFTLKPTGEVANVVAVEQGATPVNPALRGLAEEIVRAASPFPVFSADMGRQDVMCTVVLEFRLN